MPLLTKVNDSSWYKTKHWVKTADSTWISVPQIYVKTGAGWKQLYKFSWEVGSWGTCNKLCGTGTQTRTVKCKRADGEYYSDAVCSAFAGTKPATVQNCNTHTCTHYMRGWWDDRGYLWSKASVNTGGWENHLNYVGGTSEGSFVTYTLTSANFAYDPVYFQWYWHDTNGTSYHSGIQFCKTTASCSEYVMYIGHQGECNGAKFFFSWSPKTNAIVRYRCMNTGNGCSGCSGCSDDSTGKWGYLNCSSGYPSWATP